MILQPAVPSTSVGRWERVRSLRAVRLYRANPRAIYDMKGVASRTRDPADKTKRPRGHRVRERSDSGPVSERGRDARVPTAAAQSGETPAPARALCAYAARRAGRARRSTQPSARAQGRWPLRGSRHRSPRQVQVSGEMKIMGAQFAIGGAVCVRAHSRAPLRPGHTITESDFRHS